MKRTGIRRGTKPLQTKKQLGRGKRLNPRSAKREAEQDDRARVREAVFERDHHTCRLKPTLGPDPIVALGFPPCMGPLTVHHLRKESQGGRYVMSNLLTLCAAHNDAVEFMPREDMVAMGLVIPAWNTDPGRAWALLQLGGIVSWWWDGTPDTRSRPDAIGDTLP